MATAEPTARDLTTAALPATDALPRPGVALGFAWVGFWVLLATIAVQDHWQAGQRDLWKPLLWEGTSAVVATALLAALWPLALRGDAWLARPWRWWIRPLALLPLAAPLFVGVVFALRHVVHDLAGDPYRHPPWPQVLAYEGLKFAVFYLLFAAVLFGWRSFAALQAARVRAEQERAATREAQLAQLAQQVEPHFLFNALNTIASAVHERPDVAERLLLRLATLLRAATDLTRRPEVTLDEELQLLRSYGEVMAERFAGRVQIDWQVDPALEGCRLPALLLQPLLENAFRHGVERQSAPARIDIVVRHEGATGSIGTTATAATVLSGGASVASSGRAGAGSVLVEVSCSAGSLADATARGTGLGTVEQRLGLAFGPAARLSLRARPGGGVVARLEFPCRTQGADGSS